MATLQLPQQVPSPAQDSETLRKAFQGCITDEKAVIKLLGRRNAAQRKNIGDTYQELYNQSLIDSLNSKLSGDFGRAVMLWTCKPLERDARILHKVLNSKQIGMNELAIIIEICVTSSPSHWRAIRDCYNSLFESNFHQDMSSDIVPRTFVLNLLRFIMPFRKSLPTVDLDSVNDDTTKLRRAIESKEIYELDFGSIFSWRSFLELKAIFESYHQKYGNPISEDIKDFGDEMLESLVKIMIRCIVSPEKYLAEVIRAALSCPAGVDHDSLIRVIVRRAEIDLMKVREAYFEMTETSLDNAIKCNTSGNYQDFLMALLGHVGLTMQLTTILQKTRKHIQRAGLFLVYLYKRILGDKHDVFAGPNCGVNQHYIVKNLQEPSGNGCYLLHVEGFSDGLVRGFDG
ncbi:hypothetical protein Lser_V15G39761 [Lactuca serriola]